MTAYRELIGIFTAIDKEQDMARLFEEIFTGRELSDLSLRWQLLKELHQGNTQRDIAARHKISLCKITRGSRLLKNGNSIIKRLLTAAYGDGKQK
ncbi:MAG: trp operon repressor [Proteobacteria bacterium]|nr:trp operon repressor [Pseudomonadota bacterium]